MDIKHLSNLTIAKAARAIKDKSLKSEELTEALLAKIKKENPDLNAYLIVLSESAIKSAKDSDKRRQEGKPLGPLDGIPMAIKDNIVSEGEPVSAASKILEGFESPYNATVVEKLKDAGAIILGKTNLDEFAMGSSTENSHFGPTKNPWDAERVPGGSSGGSAAAVAAGMALGALGSDTGGSIRQPASFCGVVGFKPTYGAVSRYGLIAMASSLDQIGPLAKTIEDAEIIFDIISGYDEKDSTSLNPKFEILNPKQILNSKFEINKLKIGLPKEYFGEGLDGGVRKVIEKSIEKFKQAGAEIINIALPNSKYAFSCYYIIMPVEVASNLARYDGIKYGLSAQAQNLLDAYFNTRSEGFGNEAKRRIMLGAYASSAGYVDKFYHQAQKVRTLIKKDFDEVFKKVDFILGPVAPEVAFKIGQKSEPLSMYLSDIYTIAVNLAGLPAISAPAGLSDGLPVGLQIIGPQMSDWRVLELGRHFERIRGELPQSP